MIRHRTIPLTCAFLSASTAPTAAQLHGEIVLGLDGGAIITGRQVWPNVEFPWAVFQCTLGVNSWPNTAVAPGFDSLAGTFPPGTPLGITLRRSLRAWNGTGFSNPAPMALRITRSASITTPAVDPADCRAGSLLLGEATAGGSFHQHPLYELLPPATDGVYLLELEVWRDAPGLGVSGPVYVVVDQYSDPSAYQAALAWTNQRWGRPCRANCDHSTAAPVLNVADFTCFLQQFAAGACEANCDRSTTAPALNVADFTCFLQQFAGGCE